MEIPATRYAPTLDGGYIAYKVIGDGPTDLAYVSTWATQIEVMWDYEPCARYWLDLASSFRLIVHDRRGTGLSDAGAGLPNLETRAADLLAVLDHAGASRAHLYGHFDGGMVCALFAAAHPERVESFLWGDASAKGVRDDGWPYGPTPDELESEVAAVVAGWGTEDGVRRELAEPASDEFVAWLAKMRRAFCGPASAADYIRLWGRYDVRDILPALRVRTRIMEGVPETDPQVVGEHAATAALIPGAEHKEIPTSQILFDSPGPWLASIREFIGVQPLPAEIDRVLATVLFTDIVGSTERAAELGDSRWTGLLHAHDQVAHEQIDRFRGRYVHTTGDGLLATFDGPARAVRCAQAISVAVRELGLEIRAGCHTGEIELAGDDVQGVTVHVGARVAALADRGEVLVSSTVKDLSPGSGLAFEDAGEHELKGVPDPWHLYKVVST